MRRRFAAAISLAGLIASVASGCSGGPQSAVTSPTCPDTGLPAAGVRCTTRDAACMEQIARACNQTPTQTRFDGGLTPLTLTRQHVDNVRDVRASGGDFVAQGSIAARAQGQTSQNAASAGDRSREQSKTREGLKINISGLKQSGGFATGSAPGGGGLSGAGAGGVNVSVTGGEQRSPAASLSGSATAGLNADADGTALADGKSRNAGNTGPGSGMVIQGGGGSGTADRSDTLGDVSVNGDGIIEMSGDAFGAGSSGGLKLFEVVHRRYGKWSRENPGAAIP